MLSQKLVFDFVKIITFIELLLIKPPKIVITLITLVPSQKLVFDFEIVINLIKLVLSQKLVFDFIKIITFVELVLIQTLK